MNRHVVTVNYHMILWKSTSIDTLWTYMGFYHTLSIYYFLPYIGRSHNNLKYPKVVRSLIQGLWELKDSNLVLRIFSPTHRPTLLNSHAD